MSDPDEEKKELRQRVEQLEETVSKMIPGRRGFLKGSAAALTGAGATYAATGGATGQASDDQSGGKLGSPEDSQDVWVDRLYDPGDNQILDVDGGEAINAQFGRAWYFDNINGANVDNASTGTVPTSQGDGTLAFESPGGGSGGRTVTEWDGTSSLQTALNNAGANSTVYLPEGTYQLSDITPQDNQTIVGSHQGTILEPTGNSPIFSGDGLVGPEIANIAFDGLWDTQSYTTNAVNFTNTKQAKIHDNWIANMGCPSGSNGAIYLTGQGTSPTSYPDPDHIYDNKIEYIRNSSFGIYLGVGREYSRVNGNAISDAMGGGVNIDDGNCSVQLNHIDGDAGGTIGEPEGGAVGISVTSAGSNVGKGNIVGNTINHIHRGPGIDTNGVQYMNISNNIIYVTQTYGIVLQSTSQSRICGNSIGSVSLGSTDSYNAINVFDSSSNQLNNNLYAYGTEALNAIGEGGTSSSNQIRNNADASGSGFSLSSTAVGGNDTI